MNSFFYTGSSYSGPGGITPKFHVFGILNGREEFFSTCEQRGLVHNKLGGLDTKWSINLLTGTTTDFSFSGLVDHFSKKGLLLDSIKDIRLSHYETRIEHLKIFIGFQAGGIDPSLTYHSIFIKMFSGKGAKNIAVFHPTHPEQNCLMTTGKILGKKDAMDILLPTADSRKFIARQTTLPISLRDSIIVTFDTPKPKVVFSGRVLALRKPPKPELVPEKPKSGLRKRLRRMPDDLV